MKNAFYAAAGGVASLIATSSAHATYIGLSAQLYTTVNVGGGLKSVFRLYATFTDANDYLTGLLGSGTVGPLVIKSVMANGVTPGSNFFNPGGTGGNTAPSAGQSGNLWGTFATIGVSMAEQGSGPSSAPDQTALSPSFPNFINGNLLSSTNIGWFTPGPKEQGRAGYLGDGDAQLRVMFAQLTVDAGSYALCTVAVNGVHNNGQTFQFAGQILWVPAPAGLAALSLAAISTPRRRRRW